MGRKVNKAKPQEDRGSRPVGNRGGMGNLQDRYKRISYRPPQPKARSGRA